TTLSEPLGMEVRVTAFASGQGGPLGYATFYRDEIQYRGAAPLDSAYVTFRVDPDLGNYVDDYIGSDTTRNLGFVYNSDDDDEEWQGGYGVAAPAQGVRYLETPGDLGMTVFGHYFSNGDPRTGNVSTASDFYYH